MKSISSPVILSGIRAKVDGSLGLSLSTPELSPDEKVLFMSLQNKNCQMALVPTDEPIEEETKVKGELAVKTPGQRLRAVLFVLYKQDYEGKYKTFSEFYEITMNRTIESFKGKLN